jgi:hypothetical protein
MAPVATQVEADAALFHEVARFNCDAGDLAQTIAGCVVFRLDFPDGAQAHVALRHIGPDVVELTAAQGQGGALAWLPWLESQIHARAMRLVTQRRGLIRQLGKHGYRVAGVVLEKELYGRQEQLQ